MVIRALLVTGLASAAVSAIPAFAQSTTTIIRDAVPAQKQTIIANSPEDLALQEEIRKIRAYNAYVDSQVGVSGTATQSQPTTIAAPATTNTYSGAKIELFETSTPAPTTTIIERQPVAGATSIYRVVEGDTLYNISKRNCLDVADIQNQNGLSGSNIGLGQVLTIPASKCGASSGSFTGANAGYVRTITSPAVTTTSASATYAVLPKDSLYSIGRRYCVSVNELAVANGISTTSVIQPGQILRLPAKSCVK